ncbi:eCIS core domain-containing protein [Streptomyces sp. C11-1]|uniref:eCIS core domain-containing protein n=1 Tax=Streptomyces sp. C11-1 TaxID=3444503 RepID=UPI0037DA228A
MPARDRSADGGTADRAARSRRTGGDHDRPPSGLPGALHDLQRTLGNAAVAHLLTGEREARSGHEDLPVQRSTAHQVLRSPGRPMQEPLRREMEGRLGADFSAVRIHADSVAQRSAAEIGARAYTSGDHVVLTDGGQDKRTLAHELTHVIQQRQGPVEGTDTGGGLRVSDPGDRFEREAEANATRVMAAPVRCADAEAGAAPSPASGTGAVVQRKGSDPLGPSLPAEERRADGLLGRWKALTRTQPEPGDAVVAEVRAAVVAYDGDTKRDPMHCLMKLSDIQQKIAPAQTQATGAALAFLEAARKAVEAEMDVVANQLQRDDSLPDEARGPFSAMTDTGMLWNREEWADSAAVFGMKGATYFRELSELNRAGMAKEIAGRGAQEWVPGVESRLTTALNQSVLCHYTTAPRADQMVNQGRMKSKSELLRENPDAANNSEPYDKHGLANEGFVFFFLEVPGSPFRETRFGGGDAARIEIPLTASPLMNQGWLMLSDFAQRDYPTVRAQPGDPARTESKLPTREDGFSADFSLPVRKFDSGANRAEFDMEQAMEEMQAEQDAERRSQIMFVMAQVAADQHSAMTYGAPGPEAKVYSERLRSNTLMGRDIVPGLVERAVLEIQRLMDVNPRLAEELKAMSGNDLMQFLLKDLLRPQAMLPNSVDLGGATVVRRSAGRPATATA